MQSKAVVAERASGSKFRALTLDFWGTMVDWLPVWESVSSEIVKKHKLKCSAKEFALSWRRAGRWYVEKMPFLKYKDMVRKSLEEVCKTFGVSASGEEQKLFERWGEIEPFPETAGVFNQLKKKHKLVIVSNADPDLFEMVVKKIPVDFDGIFVSDETGVTKPHVEMYNVAVKYLGIPRQEILHVASSQMDVCGATNAGLTVCWINRRKEEKSPETPKPKYEISDLRELLNIVE
jgi:2-haloacid dehalogenase